jgi:hypothetical protein
VRRSLEQIEAERAIRSELAATRDQLLNEYVTGDDRRLLLERLSALTGRLIELEEGARPPPPPPLLDPTKISREEALERAKKIRANPAYWTCGNGTLPEARALLVQEVAELDAIAAGEDES